MRVLMIGDVVGRIGRQCVRDMLEKVKENYCIDFTIANGENAAGGTGITKKVAAQLFSYGVDILTMGNHTWDNKDIYNFIDQEERIVRPANYPPGTPGVGSRIVKVNNLSIGIINILGRVFLPPLDCPFRVVEKEITKMLKITPIIIVDIHAEATSEKIALGYFLEGRASAVLGTHTHVQTADERILKDHTAFLSDVGMTGPYDSVIGVERDLVIDKFITQLPVRFEVARGENAQFNAVVIEIEADTGRAVEITRIFDHHSV